MAALTIPLTITFLAITILPLMITNVDSYAYPRYYQSPACNKSESNQECCTSEGNVELAKVSCSDFCAGRECDGKSAACPAATANSTKPEGTSCKCDGKDDCPGECNKDGKCVAKNTAKEITTWQWILIGIAVVSFICLILCVVECVCGCLCGKRQK